MDLIIVSYTFIGFLFLCIGSLFCQCCMIRYAYHNQEVPMIYLYQPTAPPLDYERLAEDEEEPTEATQV